MILYADTVTPSMRAAMDETERRRKIQDAYNKAHGIVPKTIIKDVREILEISKSEDTGRKAKGKPKKLTDAERTADRPWLLPDWNSTIRMIARPQSSCKIVTTVFIVDNLRTFIRAQAQKIILQNFIIP